MAIEKRLPNILTFANLFSGFFGLLACFNGDLVLGGAMVFAGAFFDVCDGFAARMVKHTSLIGKELDSLADVVTFGLLPAMIVHMLILRSHENWLYDWYIGYSPFISLVPFLLVMAAAYRLAKFNVDASQSKIFKGLPTPANGLFFASFPLIMEYDVFVFQNDVFYLSQVVLNSYLLIGFVFLFSWLMVSSIPLFSFKFKNFSWADNKVVFSFLIISVLLFIVLLWSAVPLIIFIYIILSFFYKTKSDEIQSAD